MSLDQVVNVSITRNTVFPTRTGFGIPLLMVAHSVTPNRVDEYTNLRAMVSDGWSEHSRGYRMASKAFSQNPRPVKVLIGKRANASVRTVRLTPVNIQEGYTYLFSVIGNNGIETEISYTVGAAATVAIVVTAIRALIDAIGDVAAADNVTHMTLTSTAGGGTSFNLKNLPPMADLKVQDMTADPGIAADLNAVQAIDDSWYGVSLDSQSEAEINATATWTEARRKVFVYNSSDSIIAESGVTTDVASDLVAAAMSRSAGLFDAAELESFSAVAWMGGNLPNDPGSNTWTYRTLNGVTVSRLTDTQRTAIHNKSMSTYETLGGLNSVRSSTTGKGNTGALEWIDTVVGTDWLLARIQETCFGLIKSASDSGKKIPYTQGGAQILAGGVRARLEDAVNVGFLSSDEPYVVTVPVVAEIDPAEKAARNMPGIEFEGTIASAIHSLTIQGNLSL